MHRGPGVWVPETRIRNKILTLISVTLRSIPCCQKTRSSTINFNHISFWVILQKIIMHFFPLTEALPIESPIADQRSLTISGNYQWSWDSLPFCHKSKLSLLLQELALFLLPCAQAVSSNKKLCLPKGHVEAIFISMVLLSKKNLERAWYLQQA